MNKDIVKIVCGSRLFGVETEHSDIDIKSVFVVTDLKELYLGPKTSIISNNGKEGKDKEEYEYFYSRKFAQLLYSGQTITFDMLFAPDKFIVSTTDEWEKLRENKENLVSKNIFPFVHYARSQASKYSLKGNKLKTLKHFISDIEQEQRFGNTPDD